ncbi:CoA transferase [Candidatus Poriferisodalis sp.]|uniref:CoA transferase n=1 Tax=Candidatus Poriferisodalis sp. TaxID=3101277 RepID=UPI003B5CC793
MSSADGARSSDSPVRCLDGVRVVELTTGIAAPYAARFLADQGADVVKVEPPGGDPYRSDPGFQAVSRNKRSVVPARVEWERAPLPAGVNGPPASLPGILRPTAASLAAPLLSELLSGADAVFVPDADTATAARNLARGAVIVSCPTWGDVGPYATRAGTPSQVAAVTGIGWNQISYSEGPVELVVPLASYGAGMLGAMAAAAGLYARQARGAAPTYNVSEVSGSGAMQIGDFEMPEMAGLDRDGSCPLGSAGRLPVYRLFPAADDRWMFVACGTLPFYVAMLRAIGREDLLGDKRFSDPPWGLLDLEPLAEITPILEEAFAARPLDEWLEILRDHDVPCQPTQTREEFMASPLAEANRLVATVEHPDLGEVRTPPQPMWIDGCDAVELQPAPRLGEHNGEVAAEIEAGAWSTQSGPDRAAPGAAPLAGLKAVDLSSFIAGPVITRHLAMLGAEVTKIEQPGGDPFRVLGPYFNGWNQSKRSVRLNLKDAADHAVMAQLVADADVIVENFRPGVAERLGCSDAELRRIRPDAVLVKSPGYGRDESMAEVPAFDPLLQALGGIMSAQGGDDEPVFLTVPVHDAATPMIATFGVLCSLYRRLADGEGRTVRTSLTQTVTAAQAAEFVIYDGRPPAEMGGLDYRGAGPDRTYLEVSTPDGPQWVWHETTPEGTSDLPAERRGFVRSEVATSNGHVVDLPETEWGPMTQVGSLIGGIDVPMRRAPFLDEHREEIQVELGARQTGSTHPAPVDWQQSVSARPPEPASLR